MRRFSSWFPPGDFYCLAAECESVAQTLFFIQECVMNFWRRHVDDVGTLINNRDMRLDCGLEKNADKSVGALTLTTR